MYCDWPFTQLFINEDGAASTCCPGWTSLPLGNVLNTPPMELWRGEKATLFRESIRDQSFRYCINCGNPETLRVSDFPKTPANLDLIGCLMLAHDPTCNLTCASCRSFPRKPGDLAAKIQDVVLSSGVLKHTLELNVLGGGDPFASPLTWSMLTSKIDCHPDMRLTLKTNGILATPERLSQVEASGKVIRSIGVSIDAATRGTYALNRGGDWDRLLSNMEKLRDLPYGKQWNFVVQANNFREMVEFVKMSSRYEVDVVYFSALDNWGYYPDDEYRSRAVHLPTHPQYDELRTVLRDPVLLDPRVIMGKLPAYRPGHVHDHRLLPPT